MAAEPHVTHRTLSQRSALVQSSIVTRVASAHHFPRTSDLWPIQRGETGEQQLPRRPSLSPGAKGAEGVPVAKGAAAAATGRLNPLIIETWLNETLKEAGTTMDGGLMLAEKRTALGALGLDRGALGVAGVGAATVERLYRGLFVYSVGFYSVVTKALAHAEGRQQLVTRCWKAFALLLEHCCRSDYELTVARLEQEHRTEMFQLRS